MVKDKPLKVILWSIAFTLGLVLSLTIGGFSSSIPVHAANAYDISEYQGYVNDNQAGQLKNEVNFMILKAENGGLYTDPQFNHNAAEMSAHNIPYGAYDYSLYANPAQAQSEAAALYQRAPGASFYVNDSEENNAGSQLNASTQAWANEIHQLTTKPAVLYSGLSFMNRNFTPETRNTYDGLWIAAYGSEPAPDYHYDLWQYTDRQYSPALGQNVDASVFPDGNNKPLSFWTNDSNDDYRPTNERTNVVKPKAGHHQRSRNDRTKRRPTVKPTRKRQNQPGHHRESNRVTRWRNNRRGRNRSRTVRHRRQRYVVLNPNYYRSKKVKLLRVIGRHGINLYTMHRKYIGHVNAGTILNVYGYVIEHHQHIGYITKAVGEHHGKYDLFTSRKNLVKWYRN